MKTRNMTWTACASGVAIVVLSLCTPVGADGGKPEKFALLVGITEYSIDRNGATPLNGCVNDVKAMRRVLVEDFEFKDDTAHVVELTNKQATHHNIVETFRNFLIASARAPRHGRAKPELLFYFSGHGAQVADVPTSTGYLDEADGHDETLVPYDGFRDLEGNSPPQVGQGRYDIIDDELDILYTEAAAYTPNITFIFDCCCSSTLTRAPYDPNEPHVKEAPRDDRKYPTAIHMPGMQGLAEVPLPPDTSSKTMPDNPRAALAPRKGNFVALAGCLAQEQSLEKNLRGWHGLLTYFLVKAMREATPTTTANTIWARVAPAVSNENLYQNPQLEGKRNLPFLGGTRPGKTPRPPAKYEVQGNEVSIECSPLDGARPGGYVALQIQGRNFLRVRLTRVKDNRAYSPKPEQHIPPKGTARFLTPFFGSTPVRIRLELANRPRAVGAIQDACANSDYDLIKLVGVGEEADMVVRFDKYSTIEQPESATPEVRATQNSAAHSGFYIKYGDKILYDLFLEEHKDKGISNNNCIALIRTLENWAHQHNLEGLSNKDSKLKSAVRVALLQVKGTQRGGDYYEQPLGNETPLTTFNGLVNFKLGTGYKFRLYNITNRTLYAAVVGLKTDGAVELLPDRNSRTATFTLKPYGPSRTGTTITVFTTPPGGSDKFKILISTQPVDAGYLERDAVKVRSTTRGPSSLTTLLTCLNNASRIRGVSVPKRRTPNFDDWDVVDFTVQTNAVQELHTDSE